MRQLRPVLGLAGLVGTAALLGGPAAAQEPLHPEVILRDGQGQVVESLSAADSRATCGECHNVDFIVEHTTHGPEALTSWPYPGVPRGTVLTELLGLAGPATGEAPGGVPNGAGLPSASAGGDCFQCHLPTGESLPVSARTTDCASCHGLPAEDPQLPTHGAAAPVPLHGEAFAPGRLSRSGLNLAGKTGLYRSWDVHAERLLECSDCHASVNNPLHRRPDEDGDVEGLRFDPRAMDTGAWLQRPSHVLAGSSRAGEAGAVGCTTCHDPEPTHRWLPFAERHQQALSCESCHTPVVSGPAVESVDWTRLDAQGAPATTWRGCQGECTNDPTELVQGFEPVLLPAQGIDGRTRLAPHNLVTSWYWMDAAGQAVPLDRVQAAGDGDRETVARVLEGAGVAGPTVTGLVEAFPLHHGTVTGEWALRECVTCHSEDSRMARDFRVADTLLAGVVPTAYFGEGGTAGGALVGLADGGLAFRGDPEALGLHVLGHRRVSWANVTGILVLTLTLLLVAAHAGLRWWTGRVRERSGEAVTAPPSQAGAVYMYSSYERAWHWLQAVAILALLATGLEIHLGVSAFLPFAAAVRIHNVLGFVVVGNAALAAFYHLASGEIRQYVPEPRGFFSQALVQARYYLVGIFRGEPHPFGKDRDRKLNPLQQITYLGILNILLPLQVLTGLAMWGAQRWPAVDGMLGGLAFLAPVHALVAWLFAAFLLMHVYLTTTGPTPTAHIRAMVAGWEEGDTAHGEPVS